MSDTYKAAKQASSLLEQEVSRKPEEHLVLTGDRPTGPLHIGHLFGSLQNRVKLQNQGVPTFIVIADHQVHIDRDVCESVAENTRELVLDYLAAGLDPQNRQTFIFAHSMVPEIHQLFLPLLNLVSLAELERNPTVKEEILASGRKQIGAGMYVYPVHQASDILAMQATLVPVGKDQLPHLELCRTIGRRFNERYGREVFNMPAALLSETPSILGLDGGSKMSKSRGNAIFLKQSADETAALLKKAKTDNERQITFDPVNRPEVANLLILCALTQGRGPAEIAAEIGDGGASKLKASLTESLNEYLQPLRARRAEFAKNPDLVTDILQNGAYQASNRAGKTLGHALEAMRIVF